LDRQEGEMDELMLDGNAVAGLLREVFAVEMTTALSTCGTCGRTAPVGAVRVFRGAGVVLRCPHCDNVLVTIVETDGDTRVGLAGIRLLTIAGSV
jgi:hypothetical protein